MLIFIVSALEALQHKVSKRAHGALTSEDFDAF
jgi:hypothetical protein